MRNQRGRSTEAEEERCSGLGGAWGLLGGRGGSTEYRNEAKKKVSSALSIQVSPLDESDQSLVLSLVWDGLRSTLRERPRSTSTNLRSTRVPIHQSTNPSIHQSINPWRATGFAALHEAQNGIHPVGCQSVRPTSGRQKYTNLQYGVRSME
jgi:hypothetical protein